MDKKLKEKIMLLYRNFTQDSQKPLTFEQINHYVGDLEGLKEVFRNRYEDHEWVDDIDEVEEVGKNWRGNIDRAEIKERSNQIKAQLEKILLSFNIDRAEALAPKKEASSSSFGPQSINIIQTQTQNQSQNMNNEVTALLKEFQDELKKRSPNKGILQSCMEKILTYWNVARPVVEEVLKLIDIR